MYQDKHLQSLEALLEAVLFLSDEPVSALSLAEIVDSDISTVQQALDSLSRSLVEQNRGIQLREIAGGWRLYTHPQFHEVLKNYVASWDTRKLTQAALETLAIVAYSQPVTRAQISAIRGVNSDSSVNSLLDKALLREVGSADAPGNPSLYATTKTFLEKFGLNSVEDLPPLQDFAPDEKTSELIKQRLGEVRTSLEEWEQSVQNDQNVYESESRENTIQASNASTSDYDRDSSQVANKQVDTSVLQSFTFTLDEEDDEGMVKQKSITADELLKQALYGAAGAVEKVDLESFHFESFDEDKEE